MPESVPNGIITFPMLGDGFAVTIPSSFQLWKFTFNWYGIIIAIGFVLAYLYVDKYRKRVGLGSDDFFDFLLWAVPSAIVGARLYYVIFNFSLYRDNLLDIVKTWNGGLAIYGGVIGAAIAILIVARVKKIPALAILDAAGPGLLIGQAAGRWGNFVNREAFGGATDIFCRMGLTNILGETIYVHPTFLYESLWNLLGLLIIHIYTKKKGRKYDGQIFAFYVAWYGFIRMLIEGMRTDSLYLFGTGLRVSQLLAAVTFLAALVFLCYNGSKEHPSELLYVNRKKDEEPETTESEENDEETESKSEEAEEKAEEDKSKSEETEEKTEGTKSKGEETVEKDEDTEVKDEETDTEDKAAEEKTEGTEIKDEEQEIH